METQIHQPKPVAILPIYYSNELEPHLHLHQFPLQGRSSGASIRRPQLENRSRRAARFNSRRTEIHVPLDVRADVWNAERGVELGEARAEADNARPEGESHAGGGGPSSTPSSRLSELHLRSEQLPVNASYAIGILKDNAIYLHPVAQVHQFKPSLSYLDVISRKNNRKRSGGNSDSDSDDGPPPDPDEPPLRLKHPRRKKIKKTSEAKEVTVVVKKTDDKGGIQFQGGLSTARREMLSALRKEGDEPWQEVQYRDAEVCSPYEFSLVLTLPVSPWKRTMCSNPSQRRPMRP